MNKSKNQSCLVCRAKQNPLFKYRGFTYIRCSNCGLVTTLPYPSEKQIISHYQAKFARGNYLLLRQYAEDYLKVYRDMAHKLERYIFTFGKSLEGAKLLDIGTFTGEFLEAASALGADVYGTELQKEAVQIALKKFPGRITTANVLNTNFPHKNFDIITMLGLIEHVVNPGQLLESVTKLLKPGGIIMLQTPNSGSLLAKSMRQYWPPYAPVEHIHLFSRQSLERLLGQNGYKNIQFTAHIKKLPLNYVYQNMQNFGPEFHKLLKPLSGLITHTNLSLPFYGGEMILLAQKSPRT